MRDPSTWPEHACTACGASERLPWPPSDGLCAACRERRAAAEVAAAETAAAAKAARRGWQLGDVPPSMAGLTRSTWEAEWGPWAENGQLRQVTEWPDLSSPSWQAVVIYGAHPGQRKSGNAAALLCQAEERHGLEGVWLTVSQWLNAIQATFGQGGGETGRVRSLASRADVVVLDELSGAVVKDTPWRRQEVLDLVAELEALRVPTVVTFNAAEWSEVGQIAPRLRSLLDVPIKIRFDSPTDFRTTWRS